MFGEHKFIYQVAAIGTSVRLGQEQAGTHAASLPAKPSGALATGISGLLPRPSR